MPCVDVDVLNCGSSGELSRNNDLSSDQLWETIFSDIRQGKVLAIWFGTPCTTFSKAREVRPGPPPLRDLNHPYGFPKTRLRPDLFEQLRLGNFFALKTAELATLAHQLGVPFAIENPEPWEGYMSMFKLPEFIRLAALPGVRITNFDQCTVGGHTAKPTRLLFFKLDLSPLCERCSHPKQWWQYRDWKGKLQWRFSPHPPLVNCVGEDGRPATSAAAVYPKGLNQAIAQALHSAVGASGTPDSERCAGDSGPDSVATPPTPSPALANPPARDPSRP